MSVINALEALVNIQALKRKYEILPNGLFNIAVEEVQAKLSLDDEQLVSQCYVIDHEFGFGMECYMGIDVKYTMGDDGFCKLLE